MVACGDSNPVHDPLASSKDDRAIERRLAGHTLKWATERQSFTWELGDGTYTFADSLGGKLRSRLRWSMVGERPQILRRERVQRGVAGNPRGESLYEASIEVVINGFGSG